MLNSLAEILRRGIETEVARFITLSSRSSCVMGAVIAVVVLALYMPLFELSLGRGSVMATVDPADLVDHPEDYSEEIARRRRLAERIHVEFVDMDEFRIDQELFRSIPADLMLRYGFVPYRRDGRALVIVVSDPTDLPMIDELALVLATPIKVTGRCAVGDSVDPEEERELAARPRGCHRGIPAPGPEGRGLGR
jgi:hypothetical protein